MARPWIDISLKEPRSQQKFWGTNWGVHDSQGGALSTVFGDGDFGGHEGQLRSSVEGLVSS